MPIGILMKEHRLIEKMISLMKTEVNQASEAGALNTEFIKASIDFIRNYADHIHHGKEENILFEDLLEKMNISAEHRDMTVELVNEHEWAREKLRHMENALNEYLQGEGDVQEIAGYLSEIVDFYSRHIDKEDNHYFRPVMVYFTDEEQNEMIERFRKFDSGFDKEVYKNLVGKEEKRVAGDV